MAASNAANTNIHIRGPTSKKGQGCCTNGNLLVSGLFLFMRIYLDCDRHIFPYVGWVVQSDEDGCWSYKIAPCGMIKIVLIELNSTYIPQDC